MSDIIYRFLQPEEWDRVKSIFEEYASDCIPDPSVSRMVIAERDGNIIGILACQPAMHSEPLWIDKNERGKVNWKRMLAMLGNQMFYVFASNEKIGRMCELAGFELLDLKVYLRRD